MILLSKEIFAIIDCCIHNRRYICRRYCIWIQKRVLALIYANAFEITNFTNLNTHNKFPLYGKAHHYINTK